MNTITDDVLIAAMKAPQAEKFRQEVLKVLATLHKDAEMALDDEWDRSDDGFEAQIDNICTFWSKWFTRTEINTAIGELDMEVEENR